MGLNLLYEQCVAKYGYCLEKDDFSSVLTMYPAALVSIADGDFAHFERANIVSAIKEAASGDDLKMCEMYRALSDLLNLDDDQKMQLLSAMREELADRPEIKLIVLELMISAAEAEDGISEVEKASIDSLKTILGI